MKMSDMFDLPVKATTELRGIQNCIFSGDDKLLAATSEIDLAIPMALAINCHDELVHALSAMLEQFDADECVDFTNEADYQAVRMAKIALEKAT